MDIAALDNLRLVLDPAGQAGVAVALILLMGSVGLGLRIADFAEIGRRPGLFLGGFLAQVVGLPFVTWLVLQIVHIPASLALGMIVVACCPGGAVSNFLTLLAGGNVAFSVSLTAASSLAAALLTPASILFWSGAYGPTANLLTTVDLNPLAFILQTMILLLVPLVAGMLVAAKAPVLAFRLQRIAGRLGGAILLGVIVYGAWQFAPKLLGFLPVLLAVAIGHNALAFLLGAATGAVLRPDRAIRKALVFELGIQNSGLALVILLAQLDGIGAAAAVAAIWGVWHIIAGAIIVQVMRLLDARRQPA